VYEKNIFAAHAIRHANAEKPSIIARDQPSGNHRQLRIGHLQLVIARPLLRKLKSERKHSSSFTDNREIRVGGI
jgi:hypothetical protein